MVHRPRRHRRPRVVDHLCTRRSGRPPACRRLHDPLVDCKVSKQRYRADPVGFRPAVRVEPENSTPGSSEKQIIGYVSALESERTAENCRRRPRPETEKAVRGKLEPVVARDFTEAKPEEYALIRRPHRRAGQPHAAARFNHDVETYVGPMPPTSSSIAYLRPETAQGMFVDFKNVIDTTA